jgi:peptidyl-prolyl cis-trans isomerase C
MIAITIRHALLSSAAAFGLLALAAAPSAAQDTTAPAQTPAPEAAAPTREPAPETVVATVNGEPVTQADLTLAMSDLDPQFARLPPEQRRAAALSALIEIKLLAAQADEQGLDDDPEFQRRMEFLRERALHSALVEQQIAESVTEEAVRARYDQEVANTPPRNEVRARHILVETEEEAREIIEQLDAGANFEELANEKTTDPSGKTTGGDLGYFGPGQMVPAFETAAFALEPGSYTQEPVQSQFGWHVIKVEDKRAQQPPAFEQVRDQVRSLLLREAYIELAQNLRTEAEIEISDPELRAAVEQTQPPAEEGGAASPDEAEPAEQPAEAE